MAKKTPHGRRNGDGDSNGGSNGGDGQCDGNGNGRCDGNRMATTATAIEGATAMLTAMDGAKAT